MAVPKVSVIIPVYNTEQYLERCVSSLKQQSLADIEIILVDDGSRAECAAMCDAYAAEDSRIKVIHKANAGAGMARNTGLEQATGEYIGFVDSDDYAVPEMYGDLYEAAVQYDADLVMSGFYFVGGNMFDRAGETTAKTLFDEVTLFEGEGTKQLLLGTVGALPHEADDSRYGVGIWKNLFRRSMLEEHGLRFLSERDILSEDAMFMVDTIQCVKRAVGIPGAYYCYCRNGASLSKAYNSKHFERCMIFLKELERHMEGAVTPAEYQLYLDRLTQGYGRILCVQELLNAREKAIKFREVRARLKAICTREEIAAVLKTYPYYKLPLKQAVFAFAMKHRLYRLQKWIVMLRNR